MAENQRPLRLMTYLVPGLPVELFETIAQYLEATLQQQTMLIYESRFNGPLSSRVDPFKADLADLAFITGASYVRLLEERNQDWEFLPVGGVFSHFSKGDTAGYYSDVIIHQGSKERIKDFLDLRGSIWATNGPASTSGHFKVLKKLKERGENSSFFGSVLDSGSHLGSIQMVASKQADMAAVDSNVLAHALTENPALKNDIYVFESYGPLPTYPLMVRASLSAQHKQAICDALLRMDQVSPWKECASSFQLARFTKVNKDIYLNETDTRNSLANLSASVRYY